MSSSGRLVLAPRHAAHAAAPVGRADVSRASSQFSRGLSWMRFPSALERQFMRDSSPRRLRYFLASGVLALFVFNGFLIVDYMMVPDVFALSVKVRLLWFTPAAICGLLSFWVLRDLVPRRLSPHVPEAIVLASGLVAAASLPYILTASHMPTSQYYHVGLMVVLMYGNMVQRLRFWYALAFSIGVCAMHVASVLAVPTFNARLTVPIATLLGATAVFTLMSNYALERDERRRYLLSLRRRHVLHDLRDVGERLQQLSRMDVLTGLHNRRHFQTYLQQVWQRAQHDGSMMALVMIDVDHFKRYNDHYGHPMGDQCLARVAQVLQDRLRRPGDLVARYGGEEFIAVLPGADAQTALAAAERVREAIACLAIPHEASATSAIVTVSVGVAACRARPDVHEQALTDAADAALYQAKHAGRNRVAVRGL